MEPVAHTLVGACLSQAGFRRTTPLATATLLIAANLPDIDGACYLVGSDLAFAVRRGWTHGLAAILLLPGLLAWGMMLFDTHVRRRWRPSADPAKPWPLLAAAIVGVASHPFLDWLNNYGVRLLMPFDSRWFYGDALFIADPWLWIALGGAAMLAYSRSRLAAAAWAAGAVLLSFLVLGTDVVPSGAKAAWAAALVALTLLRVTLPPQHVERTARIAAALVAVYIATMVAGSRTAERQVRELARARGWNVDRVAAMPAPAQPLRRQVIAVAPDAYLFVPVDWTRGPAADVEPHRASRGAWNPAVAAALDAPTVQGVRQWLRFPSYEVVARQDGGVRVIIRDARFAIGNRPGFGVVAMVDLDAALQPVATPAP